MTTNDIQALSPVLDASAAIFLRGTLSTRIGGRRPSDCFPSPSRSSVIARRRQPLRLGEGQAFPLCVNTTCLHCLLYSLSLSHTPTLSLLKKKSLPAPFLPLRKLVDCALLRLWVNPSPPPPPKLRPPPPPLPHRVTLPHTVHPSHSRIRVRRRCGCNLVTSIASALHFLVSRHLVHGEAWTGQPLRTTRAMSRAQAA